MRSRLVAGPPDDGGDVEARGAMEHVAAALAGGGRAVLRGNGLGIPAELGEERGSLGRDDGGIRFPARDGVEILYETLQRVIGHDRLSSAGLATFPPARRGDQPTPSTSRHTRRPSGGRS